MDAKVGLHLNGTWLSREPDLQGAVSCFSHALEEQDIGFSAGDQAQRACRGNVQWSAAEQGRLGTVEKGASHAISDDYGCRGGYAGFETRTLPVQAQEMSLNTVVMKQAALVRGGGKAVHGVGGVFRPKREARAIFSACVRAF